MLLDLHPFFVPWDPICKSALRTAVSSHLPMSPVDTKDYFHLPLPSCHMSPSLHQISPHLGCRRTATCLIPNNPCCMNALIPWTLRYEEPIPPLPQRSQLSPHEVSLAGNVPNLYYQESQPKLWFWMTMQPWAPRPYSWTPVFLSVKLGWFSQPHSFHLLYLPACIFSCIRAYLELVPSVQRDSMV